MLTVLAPSTRYYQQQGRQHKKLTDWARQMVMQLRRWLPHRPLVLVGDNSCPQLQTALIAATSYGAVGRGRLIDVSRTTALRWVQAASELAAERGQLPPCRRVGTHTLCHVYAQHLVMAPGAHQPPVGLAWLRFDRADVGLS